MYKILSLLLVVLLSSSLAFAQGHREDMSPEMRAKFEAQKISYISQQVDISPEQAQTFWPLYNEHKKKKDVIRDEFKQLYHRLKNDFESLSEKEMEKISDRFADLKVEKAKLDREYHNKFKEVLSAKQILNFHMADKRYHGMLIRRLKGKGEGHMRRERN